MEDIELALKKIDFSKLSGIEDTLLKKLLADRKLQRADADQTMDIDELEQVTAAGNIFLSPRNKPKI